jgi:hypothetical protein
MVTQKSISPPLSSTGCRDQPTRFHGEHGEQNCEHSDILDLRAEPRDGHRFHKPDQQGSEHGSAQAPDAADDHRNEPFDGVRDTHQRRDEAVAEADETAGNAGNRRRERNRRDNHQVCVDPHDFGRGRVLRYGTDLPPEACPVDEYLERDE